MVTQLAPLNALLKTTTFLDCSFYTSITAKIRNPNLKGASLWTSRTITLRQHKAPTMQALLQSVITDLASSSRSIAMVLATSGSRVSSSSSRRRRRSRSSRSSSSSSSSTSASARASTSTTYG